MRLLKMVAVVAAACGMVGASSGAAAELYVGAATVSITPDRPVALSGQMRTRISRAVETPVTATALALESRQGDQVLDQAILVSCDLVAIRRGILAEVREALKDRLTGFDLQKLLLSATHTHTAPEVEEGRYDLPAEGIMRPDEYRPFLVARLAEVCARAWKARARGRAGWGLGHAAVAQNRLAVFGAGRARMYGSSQRADFQRFEGGEDHGVEVLFFWNDQDRLIATAINLACPAQEVENRSAINADFWHPVREALRQRHGPELAVLAWTGAAGDQSPHLMYRKAAEERMRRLRGGDRLDEIARRILAAWDEAHEGARKEKQAGPRLAHKVQVLDLPVRQVTRAEAEEARAKAAALKDPASLRLRQWHQRVVDRFEKQTPEDTYAMELHVLRLGDVAIATNEFELYTDYGIQMKARSQALQTFVIQLAGPGSYLPTARGVAGGGYGAVIQSNTVGPEGGRRLVERTLAVIDELWER